MPPANSFGDLEDFLLMETELCNVAEGRLAKLLGVSRTDLKRIRNEKLTLEVDWLLGGESQSIEITPSGQKKIRLELGLPEGETVEACERYMAEEPEKKEGGGDLPAEPSRAPGGLAGMRAERYVALVVVKAASGNKVVVVCTDPEGRPVRLRVRDNGNFTKGMRVPTCVHVEADRYDYEGRLPRRKGRL